MSDKTLIGKGPATDVYDEALVDISTAAGYQSVLNSIDNFKTDYATTNWSVGFHMASHIYNADTDLTDIYDSENRDRIVIFFTDGEASEGLDSQDQSSLTGMPNGTASAIRYSNYTKVNCEATVYTVATSTTDGYEDLKYISSDYPNATYAYAADTANGLVAGLNGLTPVQNGYSKQIETAAELKAILI